ncbi:arf-GAP with SH3 domain, ANK repeat and PH domain-containing protein 2-like isoform X2 [Acropora palmata]|uniref:arf-GAP with SH3 domain, ANK repeat and PH domain-containing protein 2-like isoform X2 n=1 Tax=Acropora palmata TaxID=6131 RepID=UPI003DA1AA5A
MPDRISVRSFLNEATQDVSSPTTSNFLSTMSACRNSVGALEESLDEDYNILSKLKKSSKNVHAAGLNYSTNQLSLAENLEKLGTSFLSKEADTGIGTAFLKFSVTFKELCSVMKTLFTNYHNMVLFPLDSLLKGDLRDIKGDMRKPFDKAWREYEAKVAKIEKEKKKIAQEAGLVRAEVTGAEIADETERERRMFQMQMCEVLIKGNEIKVKKGVELAQHLVEFYHAQVTYFQSGSQVLESMKGYLEELAADLQQLKAKQDEERRELNQLKNDIKSQLQMEKETTPSKSGYSLHGQQGDKNYGNERFGFLLKRSEGLRKVWQKRYCVAKEGQFTLAHSPTSRPTQTLNLLVCQIKEDDGKKHAFNIVSHNRTYLFQADDETDLEAWVSVLSNCRTEALEKAFGDSDKAESEENSSVVSNLKELRQRIVKQVQRLPGNDTCADCSGKDPTWLATNLGVLLCIECSGIHREMGVHISRIRSIELDKLGTVELLQAKAVGNGGFNEIMEATLDYNEKPTASSNMDERKEFIRAKYIQHKYAIKSGDNTDKILQELHQAVKSKDILAVLQAFAEGVDLSAPLPGHPKNATALHVAVEQEDLTSLHIVDFLAQNCNEVNTTDQEGNTALHVAALSSKIECMRVLLRAGGTESLNARNKDGKTALDIAKDLGNPESIELLKQSAADKLVQCENVKIDWGLNEADGIYDDPLELMDIRPELSDDEVLNDKSRSSPPTPPRHRRQLNSRPVSQMILPGGGLLKGAQGLPGISPMLSGRGLSRNDSPSIDKLALMGSPVIRRRAPVPPSGETVAVNVRASMFVPSTATDNSFTSMTSTFGHGPKGKAGDEAGSDPCDLAPIPPVRCSSVSRDRDKRFGVDGPLPPLPAKPKFDDPSSRAPPSESKTRPVTEVVNRRAPPIPPPPRRTSSDLKPMAPPLPMHRRSKSEGKLVDELFAASSGSKSKLPLEKKLSDSADKGDENKDRPIPPPRPLKHNSIRVTSSPSLVANGNITPRFASLPRPPPRRDSGLTSSITALSSEFLNRKAEETVEKENESVSEPESPVPGLPPRLHGKGSPSGLPRRVQALYDCEADNDDELTFQEGDIILVTGNAEDAEWWMGEIEGKPQLSGVFPISFVRVLSQ